MLIAGTTPVTVAANSTNDQVSVMVRPASGPVSVTLQVNGSFAGTPFVFIQVFRQRGAAPVNRLLLFEHRPAIY